MSQNLMSEPSKITDPPYLWIVAFIDILGQGNQFEKLSSQIRSSANFDQIGETVVDSALSILSLRNNFKYYFEATSQSTGLFNALTPFQRLMAEHYRKTSLLSYGISDSFVNAISLHTHNNPVPMSITYSLLFGTCIMFINGLSSGHPIRGGIDMGYGIEIDEKEVYGYPLWSAYNLESTQAEYPRVLIGNPLWELITARSKISDVAIPDKLDKGFATKCLGLIAKDEDDKMILDVLGPGMLSFEETKTAEQVGKAYDFVVQERDRFASAKDEKLHERYSRLKQYFDSRASNWDFEVQE